MKRLAGSFVVLLFALSASVVVVAQNDVAGRQKFEGKWVIDRNKSSDVGPEQDEVLQITYGEPHFKVEKTNTRNGETRSATILLFTDKRGERTKPFPFDQQREISSTTSWDKEALVREYTMENSVKGGRPHEIPAREVYRLSKDGMTLTVVEEMHLPPEVSFGSATRRIIAKRVYKRTM